IKSELMLRYPLVDEIVVMDSGSKDHTREIAESFGARVFESSGILKHLEPFRGKGENLWKALYVTTGDIIVYLDADIKNIHHRFVYGLVGPLLMSDTIKFCKAFYDRPITVKEHVRRPTGGGRVTELVVRPLFSMFFPELTQIMQPLSGEYAGFREIFEAIPFPIGYGVETGMILDIYKRWGLDVMAQVDLDRRVHRNQDIRALGKMAFVILKTFFSRLDKLDLLDFREDTFCEMIQYTLIKNRLHPETYKVVGLERPPILQIPEYLEKFRRN
ncbi:MAG: glucosyl-3-phosphoglycerate synthase, partial [Deltaproteobacteria bacterium]|nr:glucosyl-3-phosphoglycerate synthase [Deltaproteobacteria bacterium]